MQIFGATVILIGESPSLGTKATSVKLVKRNFPLREKARERKSERGREREKEKNADFGNKFSQETRFPRSVRAKNCRAISPPEG